MKDFERHNKTAFDRDNFVKNFGKLIKVRGVKGNQIFLELIHPLLVKAELTLEIGTGTGIIPAWLGALGKKMICIDFSPNMIKIARENCRNLPNTKFQIADLNNLPFDNEQFDLVIKRLAPDNLFEVYKVLKKGKDFVNFSDCKKDGMEIKKIFGLPLYKSADRRKNELLDCNFSIKFEREFLYRETYDNFDDFVRMLKIAPLIPDFLDKQGYYKSKAMQYFKKNNRFILTRHKYFVHAVKNF
ncbi:class I SAM-dependent methyltransferase [Patescibacteria group bacterium]|nr:class I SAM-dependent methyltransferase [Patescibacteria group bacterium]